MSRVLRTAWSVAWYGWLAIYNRTFRFSRVKAALIWQVLQIGFLIFVARRVRPMGDASGLEGLLVLMSVQMGWFGLMTGFSRGQFQLFQGLLVPLFQITPARPLAFFIGRVIEHVPMRIWSTLLWAWAYSAAVPGAGRWGALLALLATGALVGVLANLAGLLLVALWARVSARTMRNGSVFFGILTMAMATWAVIFLSGGGNVSDLALQMRAWRTAFGGAVAVIGGVPGLLLLGALVVRPDWVEDLYRVGLVRVIELGERDETRPGRSVWLPWPAGATRAVLSKEWIQWSRSRITRIQTLIWVFGTVGVYVAGRAMAGQPLPRVVQYVSALSLLAWGLAFSHWVVRVFEGEKAAIILYRLAGTPAGRLLWAKFLSVFVPSAAAVALSTLIGGLGAGLSGADLFTVVAWGLAALAAGTIGGFGAAAATAGEEPPEPEVMAAPAGGSGVQSNDMNAWYVLARIGGLLVPIFLVVWTGAGQPWLPFKLPLGALVGVDVALPVAALAGGYWLMVKGWEAHVG